MHTINERKNEWKEAICLVPFQRGYRPPPYRQPFAPRPFQWSSPPGAPHRPRRGLFSFMRPRVTGFERPPSAGAAGKLTDPANLQQLLANTQQVLNTIHQMGPFIEQYGPLIKNLPSMWKLYRELKSLPDEKDKKTDESKTEDPKKEAKEKTGR